MMDIDVAARRIVAPLPVATRQPYPGLATEIARGMRHARADAYDRVAMYLRNRGYPDLADEVATIDRRP